MQGPDTKPFKPSDLSGMTLWLRASLGITLVGGHVSYWADQSPAVNDYQWGGGNPQVTIGAGINGHTTTEWDGTGNTAFGQVNGAQTWQGMFGVAGFTIFYAWKYTGADVVHESFDTPCVFSPLPAADYYWSFGGGIDPGNAANDFGSIDNYNPAVFTEVNGPSGAKGQPHYLVETYDGVNAVTLYQDTAAPVTANIGVQFSMAGFTTQVGSGGLTLSQRMKGSLGELGIYNRKLNAGEIGQLKNWLHQQWGI
jgi:hypothetical protein